MSKPKYEAYPCPCDKAVTCVMDESCKGCETWAEWINKQEKQKDMPSYDELVDFLVGMELETKDGEAFTLGYSISKHCVEQLATFLLSFLNGEE